MAMYTPLPSTHILRTPSPLQTPPSTPSSGEIPPQHTTPTPSREPTPQFLPYISSRLPQSQDLQQLQGAQAPQQPHLQHYAYPHQPKAPYALPTTRDQRLQIRTALRFGIPHKRISEVLGVTQHQIITASKGPLTPQRHRCGNKPAITTPQRARIVQWLKASPSRRLLRFDQLHDKLQLDSPELFRELKHSGVKAIKTAMELEGYKRKFVPGKGCLTVCEDDVRT
ncbi:hypothetical protein B7463_g1451, partial [Scytalidium lignicola]